MSWHVQQPPSSCTTFVSSCGKRRGMKWSQCTQGNVSPAHVIRRVSSQFRLEPSRATCFDRVAAGDLPKDKQKQSVYLADLTQTLKCPTWIGRSVEWWASCVVAPRVRTGAQRLLQARVMVQAPPMHVALLQGVATRVVPSLHSGPADNVPQ